MLELGWVLVLELGRFVDGLNLLGWVEAVMLLKL